MWLLRYRDPVRYGAWRDDRVYRRHPDGAALAYSQALNRLEDDAYGAEAGVPIDRLARLPFPHALSPEEEQAEIEEALEQRARAAEFREMAERAAEFDRWLATQGPEGEKGKSGGT